MCGFRYRFGTWKVFGTKAALKSAMNLFGSGGIGFDLTFAAEIRRNRINRMRAYSNWQWHLDEVFVEINGEHHYLWRAVDHEGEVLASYVT